MADINTSLQFPDVKEISSGLFSAATEQLGDKLDLIVDLSKVLLVLVIIYFVILIISKLFAIRDSRNLSRIARGVEQINEKLDSFGKKKEKKNKS